MPTRPRSGSPARGSHGGGRFLPGCSAVLAPRRGAAARGSERDGPGSRRLFGHRKAPREGGRRNWRRAPPSPARRGCGVPALRAARPLDDNLRIPDCLRHRKTSMRFILAPNSSPCSSSAPPACSAAARRSSPRAPAQGLSPVNAVSEGEDKHLMLFGHDVVSYFTEKTHRPGDPAIKSVYKGVTFRFSKPEHKALFDAAPGEIHPAVRRLLHQRHRVRHSVGRRRRQLGDDRRQALHLRRQGLARRLHARRAAQHGAREQVLERGDERRERLLAAQQAPGLPGAALQDAARSSPPRSRARRSRLSATRCACRRPRRPRPRVRSSNATRHRATT